MTSRFNPLVHGAIGLFALISAGACSNPSGDAVDPRAGPATSGPGPATPQTTGPTTDHAGMPGMIHSRGPAASGGAPSAPAMAGMDHSSMAGTRATARSGVSAGAMDHSAMQGMDHAGMPGMGPTRRSGTAAGATDRPAMQGMDHAGMPGMAPTRPAGTATGTVDHSAMQDMDDSNMAGMAGMTTLPPRGAALAASSPANGAMVQGSPGAISLTLPQPMILESVSLSNAVGQRIPLSTALPEGPVEIFTSPVPPLPEGSYTVAWTAGTGTRTLSGTFSFMVH